MTAPSDVVATSPYIIVRYRGAPAATDLISGQRISLTMTDLAVLERAKGGIEIGALTQAERVSAERLQRHLLLLDADTTAAIRRLTFRTIDIEVAGTCNAACVFCPREALRQGRGVGIMARDVFFAAMDKALDVVETVGFVGIGEPTLNRHLPEFVAYLKARGKEVQLVTNGSLLRDALVDKLLDAGVDQIQVSFTGMTKASYDEHMLNLDFNKVRPNVERLLAKALGRIPISVSAVRTAENADDLRDFVPYWTARGARAAIVDCHSRGNTVDTLVGERPAPAPVRCNLFNTRSFVTWEGDVLACCHDISGASRLGSLVTEELATIVERKLATIAARTWWPMCAGCDESAQAAVLPVSQVLGSP